jgi:hypothetical protein
VDVFQCPECALKFRYSSELDQHIALEHPDLKVEEPGNDATSKAALRQRAIHRKDSSK